MTGPVIRDRRRDVPDGDVEELAAALGGHAAGLPGAAGQLAPVMVTYHAGIPDPWTVRYVADATGRRLRWRRATGRTLAEALTRARADQDNLGGARLIDVLTSTGKD